MVLVLQDIHDWDQDEEEELVKKQRRVQVRGETGEYIASEILILTFRY